MALDNRKTLSPMRPDETLYQLLAPFVGQPMNEELKQKITKALPIEPSKLTYIVRAGILQVIKMKL
jgi:hypothetical protein